MKQNYYVQVYKSNLKDFNDLDEEDVQEKKINIISPNNFENKVNKESKNYALLVEE